MFKNFFRGVASINATTKFEKARLQVTYSGDTHSPHEDDIQTLLKALAGQDPETKALFALQTIVTKLKTSQSRKYWNYIMKNLVILDRAADERYFVKEVSLLELPEVEEYEAKQRYKSKNIEDLVACYFRYIREKAAVYYETKSSLNVAKEKRKQFFRGKDPEVILGEVNSLKTLYNSAFEVFNTGANGHLKYKLNQYVFLLVLNTIMNILSTQYVAFICIVETFFEMDLHMASEALFCFKEFLKRTEDLISFTGNHQFIPGFQISLHELRNPSADTKLLNSMQEYIKILEEEQKSNHRGVRPSVDAFDIPRSELEPKRSEINIALFAGEFIAEKVPDEELVDDNISPPKSAGMTGEDYVENDSRVSSSPSRPSNQLGMSRQKSANAAFENTFQVGYRGLILIGEKISESELDEYKASELEVIPEVVPEAVPEQQTDQENEEEDNVNEVQREVLAYRHLTPAFKKLMNIEEEDLLFRDYDCGYSYNPESEAVLRSSVTPVANRWSRPTPELKTVGIVLTRCEDLVKGQEDEISMIDFEVDIFNRFKNMFSHEYRA